MRTRSWAVQTVTIVASCFLAVIVAAGTVAAATVTSANDYASTLQSSQSGDHTVFFTTPSGVSESETITISFASAFDTSALTEDDVDISDDGIDLTTASDCSGSEQASVAIAADVVTVTICAGDGGAIAASSVVTIEIGSIATSSGTGSNQITNPSNVGNYYVAIGGTFGDSGSIILPIGADDSISVTATVPSTSSGSGGGSIPAGDPSDTTAPVISNVLVLSTTEDSASVSWATNEPATRFVDYGLTEGFEIGTESLESAYFTTHGMSLDSLESGTEYYFRIRAKDISGNQGVSNTYTFTTLDTTPPVISNVQVQDVTTTSARITWETDEASTNLVAYGTTSALGTNAFTEAATTEHSVILTDLTPGTTYYFRVFVEDAFGNDADEPVAQFTTDADDAPPNVRITQVTEADAQISLEWENPSDEDLDGITVLRCEEDYPSAPDDTACEVISSDVATSVETLGLTNGTTYYFGLFARDRAGQFASGALAMGTPQASEEEVPSDPSEEETEDSSESSGQDLPSEPTEEPEDSSEELTGAPQESETPEQDGDESQDMAVSCGDSICSESESPTTCPVDCGTGTGDPTSMGAEDGELADVDMSFRAAEESISLETTRSGVVEVLPTSTLRIEIPESTISDGVESIRLNVGSDSYLMRRDDATVPYSADVTIPDVQTILQVSVLVTYDDGSTESVSSYLRVVPLGKTYQVIDGEEAAVSAATITLFHEVEGEFEVWDGSPYRQFNPTTTQSDGSFGWYVPNGIYQVTVSADGFELARTGRLIVDDHIVNPRILLLAVEDTEESPVTTEPEIKEETSESTNEGARAPLVQSFLEMLPVTEAQEVLETIREIPGVEETAQISTPTLAVTAGASVVVLTIAFDFLPFLQYIFSAPILFFWRRKRKGYGVVYNAISKTPIDLAVVRLFQIDTATGGRGRLVKSRVTDKGGRYFFLVQPGTYRIQVTKPAFEFPSAYLQGDTTDGQFVDIYHGDIIEVTGENAVITANIPVDPSQAEKFQAPASVRRHAILRAVQHTVALSGIVAAIIFAIIRPTFISITMIGVQGFVYILAKRLAAPRKPVSWGIVYDKETGRPLSRVVARIFEPKYNKLLETQVTDSKGRYAFVLGPNEYYATFQKEGFKQVNIDPIDFTQAQEPQEFNNKVTLETEESSSD